MHVGDLDEARALLDFPRSVDSQDAVAIGGAANLVLATAAIRDAQRTEAEEALRAVEEAADRVGDGNRILLAQAAEMLRDDTAAYRHLSAAEHLDPEALRHDVLACEPVDALLRRRGRRPAGLTAMATRLRVE